MAHYTGNQHALVWEEYLQDDEYLADVDPDLDGVAHQEWVEAQPQTPWWD